MKLNRSVLSVILHEICAQSQVWIVRRIILRSVQIFLHWWCSSMGLFLTGARIDNGEVPPQLRIVPNVMWVFLRSMAILEPLFNLLELCGHPANIGLNCVQYFLVRLKLEHAGVFMDEVLDLPLIEF